ncbi:MAG TPA: ATP-binding protein [Sphingobium sp.]|nr:ATP-binding protein [Sphingobium sp.]
MADAGAIHLYPARLEEVSRLSDHVRALCEAAAVPPDAMIDIELALAEAANNIIIHGYRGRSDGMIGVGVEITADSVTLELQDEGEAAPEGMFSKCRTISADAESGRGVGIIQSCIDQINYVSEGGKNRLVLTKRLNN